MPTADRAQRFAGEPASPPMGHATSRTSEPAPTVLIYCAGVAPTLELIDLAQAMRNDGRVRPVVLLSESSLEEQLPADAVDGLTVVRLFQRGADSAPRRRIGPAVPSWLLRHLARWPVAREVGQYVAVRQQFDLGSSLVDRLVSEHAPAAVIVADDRGMRAGTGLCVAARRAGVVSFAVPFAVSDPAADAHRRRGDPVHQVDRAPWRRLKRRLARRFPEQVRDTEDGRLMFLAPGQVLALAHGGACMPVPWSYGGGLTDYAAVFGEDDRDRCVADGVPAGKLVVTGQCSLDALHRRARQRPRIRAAVMRRYGFDPARRLVVLAMPQHAEHGLRPWPQHHAESARLLADLAATGAAVLISLHPRSKREDYALIADAHGAVLAEERLIEMLPAADLFVAAHSSTVRWSVVLRVPTLILDDFALGARQFAAVGGLDYATARDAVGRLAGLLLDDDAYRAERIALLDASARRLDPFDGESCSRVIDFILERCHAAAA